MDLSTDTFNITDEFQNVLICKRSQTQEYILYDSICTKSENQSMEKDIGTVFTSGIRVALYINFNTYVLIVNP